MLRIVSSIPSAQLMLANNHHYIKYVMCSNFTSYGVFSPLKTKQVEFEKLETIILCNFLELKNSWF